MDNRLPFQHRPLVVAILGMVSAALPVSAVSATAGRVFFAFGDVTVTDARGQQKRASRGAAIRPGDTIETRRGRVQLRFKDGSFMSLQPDTTFRVDEYQYEKDNKPEEEKGFFSLLKGGLRTITGLVGRKNRNAFRVKTSVATIGIRGTEFLMQMEGGNLLVSVGDGSIFIRNPAGELILLAGQSGLVTGPTTAPQMTTDKPVLEPAADEGDAQGFDYSNSNDRDETGQNAAIPVAPPSEPATIPPSGPGYALAITSPDSSTGLFHDAGDPSTVTTFNSASQLVAYSAPVVGVGGIGGASISDVGADPIIGWGRWHSGTIATFNTTVTLASNQSHHYVAGIPTPAMPTTGTAVFNLLGATAPTTQDGSAIGTFNSGSLDVDFGNNDVFVNLDLTINVGAGPANLSVNNEIAVISGHTFAGTNLFVTGGPSGPGVADVRGFFAGAGAARAGLIYKIDTLFGATKIVHGSAAFTNSGLPIPPAE